MKFLSLLSHNILFNCSIINHTTTSTTSGNDPHLNQNSDEIHAISPPPSNSLLSSSIPQFSSSMATMSPPELSSVKALDSDTNIISKGCIFHKHGWWSLEVCPTSHIRHFHSFEPNEITAFEAMTPEQKKKRLSETDYILGKVKNPSISPNAPLPPFEIVDSNIALGTSINPLPPKAARFSYGSGTFCEPINRPRIVHLDYYCSFYAKTDTVIRIVEFSTCEYVVYIITKSLCKFKEFAPLPQPWSINCLKNGKYVSLDEAVSEFKIPRGKYSIQNYIQETEKQKMTSKILHHNVFEGGSWASILKGLTTTDGKSLSDVISSFVNENRGNEQEGEAIIKKVIVMAPEDFKNALTENIVDSSKDEDESKTTTSSDDSGTVRMKEEPENPYSGKKDDETLKKKLRKEIVQVFEQNFGNVVANDVVDGNGDDDPIDDISGEDEEEEEVIQINAF